MMHMKFFIITRLKHKLKENSETKASKLVIKKDGNIKNQKMNPIDQYFDAFVKEFQD